MNLLNLFTTTYWFTQPQVMQGRNVWIALIFFILVILAGFVSKIYSQTIKKKYLKKVYSSFGVIGLSFGIFSLFWLFLRQERIPFLGWRFWFLVIIAFVLWRVILNIFYLIKRVPIIEKEQSEKRIKEKYLP